MNPTTEIALRRLEDLRIAEVHRVDEKMEMTARFLEKIQEAEAKRLDAIRLVDTNAVMVANEKTVAQASVLAKQLTETTDALRNFINESLDKQTKMIEMTNSRVYEKMDQIEKFQTSSGGKSSVTMPLLMSLAGLGGGLIMYLIQTWIK